MATYTGKGGAVYSGANAIAEIRDWSIEASSEVVNDTVMGDSWMTNKPTQQSWSASFNAFWDDTDTLGQQTLTVGSEITLNLYPTGNTSTEKYWTGACIITGVSRSASFDGLIEASFSVTGNGVLAEQTVV